MQQCAKIVWFRRLAQGLARQYLAARRRGADLWRPTRVVPRGAIACGLGLTFSLAAGLPPAPAPQPAAGERSGTGETQPKMKRLPGTGLLEADTPLIDRILSGAEQFLDRQAAQAREHRLSQWSEIMQAPAEQRDQRLAELRGRLQSLIGASDPRVPAAAPQTVAPLGGPTELARGAGVVVESIRWPVLEGYTAEGLVARPTGKPPRATIVLMPDAGTSPAALAGLMESSDPSAGLPLQLAALGCRVLVPQTISRHMELRGERVELSDREYVYRTTFVLGRHPLGLEVQAVEALVDWLRSGAESGEASPVAVAGYGEGGLVALLSGALDPRIDAVVASGVWGNRDSTWSQPISRNLFGLLGDFGDAPLACMIGPRPLIIEAVPGPELEVSAKGAAPGRLESPTRPELDRAAAATRMIAGGPCPWLQVVGDQTSDSPQPAFGSPGTIKVLLDSLGIQADPLPDRAQLVAELRAGTRRLPDPEADRKSQLRQIELLTAAWVRSSRETRREMIDQLDTRSVAAFESSTAPLRERLEHDVIGHFDEPLLPPNVRSRLWRQTERWTGWEVEMDVFPELGAGGILLVPNDLQPEERRPVVVCVHGLEGTPLDTIAGDHPAYRNFAAELCERGFLVFCPQQLYRGGDRFRVLQRKANPLGKTLFALMVPQHRQLVGWLQRLPQADPARIAFYGLSYGGKSAMRIPAVVTEYGPTICSGDFNEWVLKNVSTSDRFSYVWTGEYEIFEFDLAGTFSYAEMAALICPRPFMVERGHFDAVAEDRWVAFEYAPVRHLYAARLGLPERTEIEWFAGPHTIHGEASFAFLHRHLSWPETNNRPSSD